MLDAPKDKAIVEEDEPPPPEETPDEDVVMLEHNRTRPLHQKL